MTKTLILSSLDNQQRLYGIRAVLPDLPPGWRQIRAEMGGTPLADSAEEAEEHSIF
jgi:hypothetical protein